MWVSDSIRGEKAVRNDFCLLSGLGVSPGDGLHSLEGEVWGCENAVGPGAAYVKVVMDSVGFAIADGS